MADDRRPTLHHLDRSQSQRILWLLEELDIPYNLKLYQRHTTGPKRERAPDELKQIHPLGKSPTLVTADGRVLTESSVVAKYLIETYDKSGKFQGRDASRKKSAAKDGQPPAQPRIYDSIRDDILSSFANASLSMVVTVETFVTLMAMQSPFFVRPIFNGARNMTRKMYSTGEFDRMFRYLEDELGDEDYFMGAHPGRADFMLSWPMDSIAQWQFFDFAKYPKIDAWYQRCHARPAWRRALDKGGDYSLALA